MRLALALSALALAGCGQIAPRSYTAEDWATCQGGLPYLRISACSTVAADTRAEPHRRAEAYVRRGALQAEYGQYVRAMADFGRAIRLDPRYADAYVERGLVFHQRGAFARAVADFDAALAIDPNIPLAVQRRADALANRVGSYADELRRLDMALTQDPTNAALLNNRCWTRVTNDDDLDLALADCNASIALEPQNPETLDSRGLVHIKRREFQAAVDDYNAALALRPNRGHYMYGRGIAQIRLGNSDAGHDDLAAAERTEPGISDIYATYGVTP